MAAAQVRRRSSPLFLPLSKCLDPRVCLCAFGEEELLQRAPRDALPSLLASLIPIAAPRFFRPRLAGLHVAVPRQRLWRQCRRLGPYVWAFLAPKLPSFVPFCSTSPPLNQPSRSLRRSLPCPRPSLPVVALLAAARLLSDENNGPRVRQLPRNIMFMMFTGVRHPARPPRAPRGRGSAALIVQQFPLPHMISCCFFFFFLGHLL